MTVVNMQGSEGGRSFMFLLYTGEEADPFKFFDACGASQ